MKKFLVGLLAVALIGVAAALSASSRQPAKAPVAGAFVIESEARNPWTHLNVNRDPAEFQFAIVSDRTGGHRAKVFSRAVERLNLMQPEFVVSVGDLIEGGNKEDKVLNAEWDEFDGYAKKLQMPFFYVPGNHDNSNTKSDKVWQERYGRRNYHFVYKNVLFLCMNTEDGKAGNIAKDQLDYAKAALAANKGVRWTLVYMHKPIWTGDVANNGMAELEKALADRPYTVFCGHVHRYQKFVRNGRNYYQLATTGGSSRMRGLPYAEFDQIVWVTMKKDGPVLANILLDSILPEDLSVPESNEAGVKRTLLATHPVRGQVLFEGTPVAGGQVIFTRKLTETTTLRADALTDPAGSFVLSTYAANDGAPEGEYAVMVVQRQPLYDAAGKPGPNRLPDKYARDTTTPLKFVVKPGANEFTLELTK